MLTRRARLVLWMSLFWVLFLVLTKPLNDWLSESGRMVYSEPTLIERSIR